MRSQWITKILKIQELSSEIYEIQVERPKEMEEIHPGQFFHIQCGESTFPLLRRPISVCEVQENRIRFLIRKSGYGTALLCGRKTGDLLDMIGPLGNGFQLSGNKVLVVGGGIGTAPLLELTKQLKDREVSVFLGYRQEAYLVEDFSLYGKRVEIATEDGSFGKKGYVTELLREALDNGLPDMVYACGPEVMLKEIQKICQGHHIPSQFALEERMACGVGACLVCSCKIKAEKNGWAYVRTCKEGPVFPGDEVIFDA